MTCDDFRARLDLFQDKEMERAERALFEQHFASCSDCSTFAQQREAFRLRLRSAIRSVEAPPDLGHKVQFSISREGHPRGLFWLSTGVLPATMAVAAVLVIAAGAIYFWPQRDTAKPEVAFHYSDNVAPVMQVGLRQHVHCGVLREYPKEAPTLLELASAPGSNAGLINAVESHAPEGLHVVMAHRCSFEGRDYTHVIARGGGRLMSLLITKREGADVLGSDLKAVASELDTPIYGAGARKDSRDYAIDFFATSGDLVYLVSDLDPAQNLAALRAMMPQVRAAML